MEKKPVVVAAGLETIKTIYSTVLLIFSVAVVLATIFSGQTTGGKEYGLNPTSLFFIVLFLMLWLSKLEGEQGCIVGLKEIDEMDYVETHPITSRNTSIAHKGKNLERSMLGRQLLVVFIIYMINMLASASPGAGIFNFNEIANDAFLTSGFALILTTIILGQLTSQLSSALCMLDFLNHYYTTFNIYLSLLIECSGLLHSVYFVQIIFSKITGKSKSSDDSPTSVFRAIFFWARVLFSLIILAFAFVVTLSALLQKSTSMWSGVPDAVSIILFILILSVVGVMEALQVALFSVINMPKDEIKKHEKAYKIFKLVFHQDNLQTFLIGRQIFTSVALFVFARLTSPDIKIGLEDNIFEFSDGVQRFINTGILGAVIFTTVASLFWRIIASSFPLFILSNSLVKYIIKFCFLLGKSGLCSASWPLAYLHKKFFGYEEDLQHLKDDDEDDLTTYSEGNSVMSGQSFASLQSYAAANRKEKEIDRVISVIKYIFSLALLGFALVVVFTTIFTNQSSASVNKNIHGIGVFFIFCSLIFLLDRLEGAQGCMVGLQSINKSAYGKSHPIVYKITKIAHKGNNKERYIVGRQFLSVLVIFTINSLVASIPDAKILNLPEPINSIFVTSGFSLILVTITIGQLTSQVNSSKCILDFMNNRFMLFCTYFSLIVEFSGLLHVVYLFQIGFSKLTKIPYESFEPPKKSSQHIFYWLRILMSSAILLFAALVTFNALSKGETTAWAGLSNWASIGMLIAVVTFVGLLDGMQIALFSVVHLPREQLSEYVVAYKNCNLVFSGQHMQSFLIGRQIWSTVGFFIIARIVSLDVNVGQDETIFDVGDNLQIFFNTGILSAVLVTVVASLIWRLIASSFPLIFLSNPILYLIIRLCLILEGTGICASSWVLARYERILIGYQPDKVYLEGADKITSAPSNKRDKTIDMSITVIKYMYSLALLIFSVTIVIANIAGKGTKLSQGTHPSVAIILFLFLLVWLAVMEGGLGCLVGLQSVDKSQYSQSHPKALKNTLIAHKGDNMERFIVGRQFLVVLVMFLVNMCGGALPGISDLLNLPEGIISVFVSSGLAMILTTIILGQLTSQVNAAKCMLDFINNYFMLFSIYFSLLIEYSGLLHSVYLVQIGFAKITGKPIQSKEPPRSSLMNIFFWFRVLLSCAILAYAFAITLGALFKGQTTMWDGVPEYVSVIIFFVLMALVGILEGMQIALFAVMNMPEEELKVHKIAYNNCKLVFSGNNLGGFLIGRQIFAATGMFVVAKISSLNIEVGTGENIFGVSDGLQTFFNTGLLGAIITTIIASLIWRIVASSFPVQFLSNPLIFLIIRLCLALESTGICSAAWVLAMILKQLFGYKEDDHYIASTEKKDEEQGDVSKEIEDKDIEDANIFIDVKVEESEITDDLKNMKSPTSVMNV